MLDFLKKLKDSVIGKSDDSSPQGNVDSTDLSKVVRTGLLMGLSTMATYFLSNVEPEMFGDYKAIATVALALAGDFTMRFLKNNKGS